MNFQRCFVLFFAAVIFRSSIAALTSEEKDSLRQEMVVLLRILFGNIYPYDEYLQYVNASDMRSLDERTSFLTGPPDERLADRQKRLAKKKSFVSILEFLNEFLSQKLKKIKADKGLNEEFEKRRFIYENIMTLKIKTKELVRWPRVTARQDEKGNWFPEHVKETFGVGKFKDSEVNYDVIREKPYPFDNSRADSRKIVFEKKVDLSYLDYGENVKAAIIRKIKERMVGTNREDGPTTNHVISYRDLSTVGDYNLAMANKILTMIKPEINIFKKKRMENSKLLRYSQTSQIDGERQDKIHASFKRRIVKDLIQAAGNLFLGPKQSLRGDDPGSGFEEKAQILYNKLEFDKLRNIKDRIEKFIEQYSLKYFGGIKDRELKMNKITEYLMQIWKGKTSSEVSQFAFELEQLNTDTHELFNWIRLNHKLKAFEAMNLVPILWKFDKNKKKFCLLTMEEYEYNEENLIFPEWFQDVIDEVAQEMNISLTESKEKSTSKSSSVLIDLEKHKNIDFGCTDSSGNVFFRMSADRWAERILEEYAEIVETDREDRMLSSSEVPNLFDYIKYQLTRSDPFMMRLISVICLKEEEKLRHLAISQCLRPGPSQASFRRRRDVALLDSSVDTHDNDLAETYIKAYCRQLLAEEEKTLDDIFATWKTVPSCVLV